MNRQSTNTRRVLTITILILKLCGWRKRYIFHGNFLQFKYKLYSNRNTLQHSNWAHIAHPIHTHNATPKLGFIHMGFFPNTYSLRIVYMYQKCHPSPARLFNTATVHYGYKLTSSSTLFTDLFLCNFANGDMLMLVETSLSNAPRGEIPLKSKISVCGHSRTCLSFQAARLIGLYKPEDLSSFFKCSNSTTVCTNTNAVSAVMGPSFRKKYSGMMSSALGITLRTRTLASNKISDCFCIRNGRRIIKQ